MDGMSIAEGMYTTHNTVRAPTHVRINANREGRWVATEM